MDGPAVVINPQTDGIGAGCQPGNGSFGGYGGAGSGHLYNGVVKPHAEIKATCPTL